jgi:hypothetical protein
VNRKPRITQSAAKQLAAEHIAQLDLRGWRYEIVTVHRSSYDKRKWSVVVDRFSPEGTLVDGPAVFVVDADDGSVWTLDERIVRTE